MSTGNHTDGPNGDGAVGDLVMLAPDAAGNNGGGGANPPANGDCAAAQANYDTTVDKLSQDAAEQAVLCLANAQRKAAGAPELALDASLAKEGRQEATESVNVQWWSKTDGLVSHQNPLPGRGSPAQRIAASGYCANGKVDPNENTFAWAGVGGQFSPTPRGAVDWWMQDKPHHDTLLSPAYTHTGIGVVAGSPIKDLQFAPAGTFVQEFGGCA